MVAVAQEPEFRDGFSWRTALGALFIALFMVPGGLYLGLVAGLGVGEAAEWVTIVLFAELARRSFRPLRKQEIYLLFYMAAALTSATAADKGLAGGPFSGLVWAAYFAGSDAAAPLASDMPRWAVPAPDSPAVIGRMLWHADWVSPILVLLLVELCNRVSWMGMGYALFRLTSDVEKLPFPYAPVAASGATALAEAGSESWRWRVFCTGSAIGLGFGLVYIGVPILTATFFGTPLQVFPIPFADYTTAMENVLPGAILGVSFSLGNILLGMVLPWEIVAGAAVASVLAMVVANPILYHAGLLPSYQPGSNAFVAKLTADLDVWLSVGIGVNLAVGILGLGLVARALLQARKYRRERQYTLAPPKGRGDLPVHLAVLAWLAATVTLVVLCHYLVPNFPVWLLAFFGLVWSPLNSYISARMIGITGRGVSFPYLKEAGVLASGYPRADIWMAPVPLADHGWAAQRFREIELTGTRFTSIVKAEALMLPLILIASFVFWAIFWRDNPLPSGEFPYANRYWPYHGQMQAVMMQINRPDGVGGWFSQAIKPDLIVGGAAGGLALFGFFSLLKLPLLFFYGFVGGLGTFPAIALPQALGAWMGRRVFERKYGQEEWRRMTPVVFAGFACGSGLVAMFAVAVALVAKAVAGKPY